MPGSGCRRAHGRRAPDAVNRDVLALIDAMEPRYRLVCVLAGLGGLRTGEVLGLRHQDVDTLRSAVHIRRESQEVPGHGRIVKDPKSEAGKRTVVLPEMAMGAITEHVSTFGLGPDGELITSPMGKPARRAGVSEAWKKAKEAVGADPGLHIHDLRHHAATLMARMPGITTKELMARMGHSSPRAALIYQHATEERDRAVATFLDEQLAGARSSGRKVLEMPRDIRGTDRQGQGA